MNAISVSLVIVIVIIIIVLVTVVARKNNFDYDYQVKFKIPERTCVYDGGDNVQNLNILDLNRLLDNFRNILNTNKSKVVQILEDELSKLIDQGSTMINSNTNDRCLTKCQRMNGTWLGRMPVCALN